MPGPVLHRYLTDSSKNHGVFSRTKFNTKVESLEPTQQGGCSVMSECEDGKKTFETKKVVVATGLTSQPNFPVYSGAETFGALYFHTKRFLSKWRDDQDSGVRRHLQRCEISHGCSVCICSGGSARRSRRSPRSQRPCMNLIPLGNGR